MMNERIKELFKQARQIPDNEGAAYEPYMSDHELRFARLIVQECIDTIEQNLYNSGDEWDRAIRFVSNDVKEHFGVEE